MAIEIRKAERVKSKLRLGLAGPSGSGKTMSALKIANGIGGPVCLIDTERGSGDLYANLYEYSVISLEPPFKPDILIDAIHAAEKAGFNVIIIDSLSHFWSDDGGILDPADKMQNSGKNRFTMWADLTPQHRRLVNAMLNSPKHIIGTMRSKQEYAMETDEKGKASVKKLGLAPVQREGMEYEFTVFFDISQDHYARTTKDRTNMFGNELFIMDETTGQRLAKWLNQGKDDVNALKHEVVEQLTRLEIPLPSDAEQRRDFIPDALKKLTGLDAIDANIREILTKLVDRTDKKAAHDAVFPASTIAPAFTVVPDESSKTAGPWDKPAEDQEPSAGFAKEKAILRSTHNLDELKAAWKSLPAAARENLDVEILKEDIKLAFESAGK